MPRWLTVLRAFCTPFPALSAWSSMDSLSMSASMETEDTAHISVDINEISPTEAAYMLHGNIHSRHNHRPIIANRAWTTSGQDTGGCVGLHSGDGTARVTVVMCNKTSAPPLQAKAAITGKPSPKYDPIPRGTYAAHIAATHDDDECTALVIGKSNWSAGVQYRTAAPPLKNKAKLYLLDRSLR